MTVFPSSLFISSCFSELWALGYIFTRKEFWGWWLFCTSFKLPIWPSDYAGKWYFPSWKQRGGGTLWVSVSRDHWQESLLCRDIEDFEICFLLSLWIWLSLFALSADTWGVFRLAFPKVGSMERQEGIGWMKRLPEEKWGKLADAGLKCL